MTDETGNEPHDEEEYKALVAKLEAEIKKLKKDNESLHNDIDDKLRYIEEIIISIGNPKYKMTEDVLKYLHDKYMLETYHENKTRPIRKRR